MTEDDEILDLADTDDVTIGTIRRGEMARLGYKSSQGFVRFAVAFIVNREGNIWVPIRGLHKSIAPGGCDFSVAEHVLSGETYEQAIARGFMEEAALPISLDDLVRVGKLSPTEDKPTHEAVFAYFLPDGITPVYSQEEFTSASWHTPDELERLLVSGPPTKSALLPAFRLLATVLAERTA